MRLCVAPEALGVIAAKRGIPQLLVKITAALAARRNAPIHGHFYDGIPRANARLIVMLALRADSRSLVVVLVAAWARARAERLVDLLVHADLQHPVPHLLPTVVVQILRFRQRIVVRGRDVGAHKIAVVNGRRVAFLDGLGDVQVVVEQNERHTLPPRVVFAGHALLCVFDLKIQFELKKKKEGKKKRKKS